MSIQIPVAYVRQYNDTVRQVVQQKGSRLRGTVESQSVTGKSSDFDRIGKTGMSLIVSRHQDTPITDTPHDRRRLTLSDYANADLVDPIDIIRVLQDPKSRYAEAFAMGAGRKLDDIILSALTGSATTVDSADSTSTATLASSQIVNEDIGAANSDLNFEKVMEAWRILGANDVDPNETKYFVVNASAAKSLMSETEVASADYNELKPLMSGQIVSYMGFNFILNNRIRGALSSESDPKICVAYTKPALMLGIGQDISTEINQRPDKMNNWQILTRMSFGAVRMEEELVVQVECYQTA
jgi:hypothetical protein